MKKLILLAVIMIVLSVPLAYATKNVVYVDNDDCHKQSCSCFTGEDKYFCNRLNTTPPSGVGYNVTIIGKSYIIADAKSWKDVASVADLIFLGDVSSAMVDTTKNRSIFCGNISVYDAKVFATFLNAYNDSSNSLVGCAFGSPVGINAEYVYGNNTCYSNTFSKLKDGYPTDLFSDGTLSLLSSTKISMIQGGKDQNAGWVGLECSSPGGGAPTGTYAVVNNSSAGVFWGLSSPSAYKDDTWSFFDRMVWYILDDTAWSFDTKVIPEKVTVNHDFIIVSKITERGAVVSDGTVNFTMGSGATKSSGGLAYSSQTKYYENYSAKHPYSSSVSIQNINVTAYADSLLMGSDDSAGAYSGTMNVTVNSGDYTPSSTYVINATADVYSTMSYKIWNKTDYTVIKNGNVDETCHGSTCEEAITTSDWGDVILEVTSVNSTYSYQGGSYKIISKAGTGNITVSTDKATYRPGESITVGANTTGAMASATLSIINSKGSVILENATMSTNATHWYYSYTLGDSSENGTYSVRVFSGSSSKSKSVDVLAWRIASTLDKSSYSSGDSIRINVTTSDVYGTTTFSIKMNITDPDDNVTRITTSGNITNNGTYSTAYLLPSSSVGGTYDVNIFINDSRGRTYNITKSFTVGSTDMISVTPPSWSVTTPTASYFDQSFRIRNIGNSTLYNLSIYAGGDLNNYLDVSESNITSLSEGSGRNFTAYLTLNQPGNKTGTITIENNITKYVINVSGSLTSGPQESRLFVAPTILSVVTIPNKATEYNFSLSTTATDGAKSIVTSTVGDILGIATVKSAPNNLTGSIPGEIVVEVATYAKTVGSYSGNINITSSVGSVLVSPVTVEIIGDIPILANGRLAELNNLTANITALKARGKDVSALESLYNSTKILLDGATTDYEAGDYASSKSKYELAGSNIESMKSQINSLMSQQDPAPDYGGIIWTIAQLVIITIVGITAYKNKDKIKQKLDEMQNKKKPEAPRQQEERRESRYPKLSGDEYRTDYY